MSTNHYEAVKHERDEARKVTFVLSAAREDIAIEGNASAVSPEIDAETEGWIKDELNAGNYWAWCSVKVEALLDDGKRGVDYLGACSYKSAKDFMEPGGYYDDMKNEAFNDAS